MQNNFSDEEVELSLSLAGSEFALLATLTSQNGEVSSAMNKKIQRMEEQGLVTVNARKNVGLKVMIYGLVATEKGQRVYQLRRNHALVERSLR